MSTNYQKIYNVTIQNKTFSLSYTDALNLYYQLNNELNLNNVQYPHGNPYKSSTGDPLPQHPVTITSNENTMFALTASYCSNPTWVNTNNAVTWNVA